MVLSDRMRIRENLNKPDSVDLKVASLGLISESEYILLSFYFKKTLINIIL
jgi:hypothetical protein